ncbi:MAG: LCP family protein [Phototrophicales bacterium]|nr:LCP family protein [Phototrophicales bacterium]
MSDDYLKSLFEENPPTPDQTVRTNIVPEAPNWGKIDSQPTVANTPMVNANGEVYKPIYVPRQIPTPPPPTPIMRDSVARQRSRKRYHNKRGSGDEWAWVIIAGGLLVMVGVVGMFTVLVLRGISTPPDILPTATIDIAMLPPPIDLRENIAGNEMALGRPITLDNGQSLILTPWDGTGRFTVLVMGLDRRPGETGLAYRTDTMLIVSLDPTTSSIGILSIPRDLYVEVPGYSEYQRINSAMVLGEIRSSGSGPQLTMQTVQYNLGIRINDYVVVDFSAVIAIVDAINGITVTTDYTINDRAYPDMNYGYDPFFLPAGTHNLNGLTALKFARTRHGDSDFSRATRQQQVIFAIRDKVLDFDMLPTLIFNAPSLLSSLSTNVSTSISLENIIRLAWYLKDIPRQNIQTGVIDGRYVTNYTTARSEAVLIPQRSTLGELMVSVFGQDYGR